MQFAKGGTILAAQTLASTTSQTIDLLGLDTVALQVNYANATTAAKTFISGTKEVQTITVPALVASAVAKDFLILTDGDGLTWATYFDKTGSDTAPAAAAYTAVPAGRKAKSDISAGTANTDIVTAMKAAFESLTGNTAAMTLTGTTTLIATMVKPNPCANPVIYATNGTDPATDFSGAETTPGVAGKVDLTADSATITAHGQVTGVKGQLTTSGGLPTGLSTSTDYFIIRVDADTVKFAASLALAVAGTAIDLTGYGTGTQTFTPTTSTGNVIKAQASLDGTYWTDITTANFPSIKDATVTVSTATSGVVWDLLRPTFRYVNILFTPSAGQITFSVLINAKTDK